MHSYSARGLGFLVWACAAFTLALQPARAQNRVADTDQLSLSTILRGMHDPSPQIRADAARQLQYLKWQGYSALSGDMRASAIHDELPAVRAFGTWMDSFPGRPSLPALLKLLEDSSPDVRESAVATLQREVDTTTPAVHAALLKHLQDQDVGVRIRAAHVLTCGNTPGSGLASPWLGQVTTPADAEPVIKTLLASDSTYFKLRALAVVTCESGVSPQEVPVLLSLLSDREAPTRRLALLNLEPYIYESKPMFSRKVDPRILAALPQISPFLDAKDDMEYATALRILSDIGVQAQPFAAKVSEGLGSPDPQRRLSAIQTLSAIGFSSNLFPKFEDMMLHDEPLRQQAYNLLVTYKRPIWPLLLAALAEPEATPKTWLPPSDYTYRPHRQAFIQLVNQYAGSHPDEAKAAIPILIQYLTDTDDPRERQLTLDTLSTTGLGTGSEKGRALQILRQLASGKDADGDFRSMAIILKYGSEDDQKQFAALMVKRAVTENEGVPWRPASEAMRTLGAAAAPAIPYLIHDLDLSGFTGSNAAGILVQIANNSLAEQATEMIGPLQQVANATASSDRKYATVHRQIAAVVTALETKKNEEQLLRIKDRLRKTPSWVVDTLMLAAAYLFATAVMYLLVIFSPQTILWLNNRAASFVPVKFRGVEGPLGLFMVFGMFRLHPRVIDQWVEQHIDAARKAFEAQALKLVGKERALVPQMPVIVNEKDRKEFTPDLLRQAVVGQSLRLLICGQGGSGKTTLALSAARWVMHKDKNIRPTPHRMLVVMAAAEKVVNPMRGQNAIEFVSDQLTENLDLQTHHRGYLLELVKTMLSRGRLLLFIDGISEREEDDQTAFQKQNGSFQALIMTGRRPPADVTLKTTLTLGALAIAGTELARFTDHYIRLNGHTADIGNLELMGDAMKLYKLVGRDRDVTVLFATMYADQMIARASGSAEPLPEDTPSLLLEYLNRINRDAATTAGFSLRNITLHKIAMQVAWESLQATLVPQFIDRHAIENKLRTIAPQDPAACLDYMEFKLRLTASDRTNTRLRFVLDPLAEYYACMHLAETCKANDRELETAIESIRKAGKKASGLAACLFDCCSAPTYNRYISPSLLKSLNHLATTAEAGN